MAKNGSYLGILLFVLIVLFSVSVFAQVNLLLQNISSDSITAVEERSNAINLFYSNTCPHCHEEMKFLDEIKVQYPTLKINYYEISNNENRLLLLKFAEYYNTSDYGVPRTFILDKAFIGFDKGVGELTYEPSFKAYVGYKNLFMQYIDEFAVLNNCSSTSSSSTNHDNLGQCILNISKKPFLVFLLILIYLLSFPLFVMKIKSIKDADKKENFKRGWIFGLVMSVIVSFFVFMLIMPDSYIQQITAGLPFPLFVFIISLADGFNPCAFSVLFILLTLLTYTQNKKDMTLIGCIFILTSSIMYFIFILAMIIAGSFFMGNFGHIIFLIIGILILVAGFINLKDYFFFKQGFSLSISDKHKEKFTDKARHIVKKIKAARENDAGFFASKKAYIIAILGTILLAIAINFVELGCTAILPTVYMTALITKYGSTFSFMHLFWTVIYALIYVIPLFAILFNFIFAFKSQRLTENHGKLLKLFAGILMIFFGIIMIFNPTLLVLG